MKRGHKAPADPLLESLRLASADDTLAVEFMEARRWGETPACPLCGSLAVYKMRDKAGARNKDCRWRCRDCKRMYTVRTGTVMEESRLPLRVWVHAFWRACSSKKGVSAKQIQRECEVSYKSALFVMHRIRAAMGGGDGPRPKLSGVVEVDETYCGGKPRNKGGHNKRGRGAKKTPVIGMVQRGGDVRLSVMPRLSAAGLKDALAANIDLNSTLITDESNAYTRLGAAFKGGHESVNHSRREYARGMIHSNTIEGAFSLLKRGLYGTFHSVSRKHLHRYLAEFEFRYNARNISDAERAERAIKGADGKRLTYADQVGSVDASTQRRA